MATTTTTTTTTTTMIAGATIFDMGSLRTHLPLKRRGLSNCFSGKSRSFAFLGDAKCVDDLRKVEEIPEAKRRKYSDRRGIISSTFLQELIN